MLLVFLGIIVILGWTGLFVLISWLINHVFSILNIIEWIFIGWASLIALIILIGVVIFIFYGFKEFIEWIIDNRKNPNRKELKKSKNKNITSDTNYTKSDKEF